ncbi:hypothetical protein BU24DRAFT_462988 [Aaosphaeria arxii CBS 175.79]|uniref:Uncharacterized protein n=1 Tax=Aaosphaeria arxii CBS 175.79 TaxID=1450172 RepID=A0A6A5XLM7_9PLEO|nr:uncharacterized protein BU24DRAFT_462988 [Aaosphaeria arxii CBS 175.79]KAF2014178.1 hypothetical protein BU24DRAFT_462988 [Aaosphaeria arxii CBS 175.79]
MPFHIISHHLPLPWRRRKHSKLPDEESLTLTLTPDASSEPEKPTSRPSPPLPPPQPQKPSTPRTPETAPPHIPSTPPVSLPSPPPAVHEPTQLTLLTRLRFSRRTPSPQPLSWRRRDDRDAHLSRDAPREIFTRRSFDDPGLRDAWARSVERERVICEGWGRGVVGMGRVEGERVGAALRSVGLGAVGIGGDGGEKGKGREV